MKKNDQRGIIHLIVLIFVALLALSYFGIDLEEVFTKPLLKKNINFTWDKSKEIWTDYVYEPIMNIFNKKDGDTDTTE
ncbi:MAG TPA: hypothetical protein VJH94_00970 [Candidatus Paceibacterota bacterium]